MRILGTKQIHFRSYINHTSWMTVVALTELLKSVCNRCVLDILLLRLCVVS